jgi:hypothetical protein
MDVEGNGHSWHKKIKGQLHLTVEFDCSKDGEACPNAADGFEYWRQSWRENEVEKIRETAQGSVHPYNCLH